MRQWFIMTPVQAVPNDAEPQTAQHGNMQMCNDCGGSGYGSVSSGPV